MQNILTLVPKLKSKLSNPSEFIRNVGWLSLAEVTTRIVRLGVTVVLARFLTSYDYGLAAIIAAVGEFTRVFMVVGIGTKIIQADHKDLKDLCNSAYWLNWVLFLGLFVAQCAAAFPVSWFYHDSQLILPICVSGIPYLIWPISSIHGSLIERDNRLKITAFHNILYNLLSYVLSAIFAWMGMGIWAIVLPWVVVAPIGVLVYYMNHPWRPSGKFTTKHWSEIFNFGKSILGVQLLKALRNNLDYLIVGKFVGIKELGTYFFGFNAGLGISLSVISALISPLFPYLCAARSNWSEFRRRYFSSLRIISFVIIPLVLLQSVAAPFYVPVVFGRKWEVAVPILILICLSAIPRPFADAASQLLIAVDKPHIDLRWNVIFTTMFAGALLIGVHWQAIGVATSVLLLHVIFLPLFSLWTTRYVLRT